MSERLRVRSISLRSIRGIRFRKGVQTWTVERVSYSWSVEESRRLAVKIEGLTLDFGKGDSSFMSTHKRNLTLADLDPSPIARRLWGFAWTITTFLEPFFRPFLRWYLMACLRLVIKWLPKLTQALSFDVHSCVVTSAEIPGGQISAEKISLHMALVLTQVTQIIVTNGEPTASNKEAGVIQSFTLWKKRLADGFRLALDTALGETRGVARVSLKVSNLDGSLPRISQGSSRVSFLRSPGTTNLGMTANFSPKESKLNKHGLSVRLEIDDCLMKVDLLNEVLDKVFPRGDLGPALDPPVVSPAIPIFSEGPRFSLASPASAIVSPVYSFTSSLFSPSDPSSAKSSILSPTAMLLSPRSSISASSPLFKALSASMRPRRRQAIQPSKLKDYKDASRLLILRDFDISIISISLSFSVAPNPEIGTYRALVEGISIVASLSDRSKNSLHKEHIGSREGSDSFETDAYALNVTLRQVTLERDRLLQTMGIAWFDEIACQTLIYQWPSPFLNPSPFMRNDGNASLLAVKFKLASMHFTDRIDEVKRLLIFLESKLQKDKGHRPESLTTPIISMPRLVVDIEIGTLVSRIIYDADHCGMYRTIELRNNGIGLVLNAEYRHPTTPMTRLFPAASSVQYMHWTSSMMLNVEPVLVRVRPRQDFIAVGDLRLRVSDIDFLDDPPILSIGTIEAVLTANAVAQIDGTAGANIVIDETSLAADLSASFETVCVELWHPFAVDAGLRLTSLFPKKLAGAPDSQEAKAPRLSFLPIGLSSRLGVGSLVCVVTAPDINPDDKVDLSVGFSIRMTPALEYCSLRTNHTHWFDQPERTQNRIRLQLASEVIPEAIIASQGSSSHDSTAVVKIQITNLSFREAVATQFEPDEPAIVGREETSASRPSRDIVLMSSIQLNISLSAKPSVSPSQPDLVNIAVKIPSIRGNLHLACVYSILLGLQTVRLLTPSVPPSPTPPTRQSSLSLTFRADIPIIQCLISLPAEKLYLHVSGLCAVVSTDTTPNLKWTQAALFVPMPPLENQWATSYMEDRAWDELLRLQCWEISLTTLVGSLCIAIDGDSARIRIPYGFVLADLMQDINIAWKAVCHLFFIARAGCYSEMPLPEVEGPKSVPHLTLRLPCLCVDIQDDPFETKLGLICQIGESAIKQRMEREEAFSAKVSAILAAEPELAQGFRVDVEHEYAFDAKHTVSIAEARKRLDDVHALDWSLRLRSLVDQQSKSENNILRQLRTSPFPHHSDSLPEFIHLPPQSLAPPLLRIILQNLCLVISPPSFSIDQLPQVLQSLGKVPQGTEFSLLVPLHVHFTLSSLQATLRNYPLSLLQILSQTKPSAVSLTFDTDLIIGEEMGTEKSVEWIRCPIMVDRNALHGDRLLSISVPKTMMPVKTYAAPNIHISSPEPTVLSWAVSYMPAIQDVMRIVDTFTSPTRDSSPVVGFWDKLRLVLHWTANVTFLSEICLYMKGTRDPHKLDDTGAGFVLCWQGDPKILIGHDNYQKELMQVVSKEMLIAVPDLGGLDVRSTSSANPIIQGSKSLKKVFARLTSGVRFGLGFLFERSCGSECAFCSGSTFHRKCRYFSFRPHHEVKLELKDSIPEVKATDDSFNEFRSDFVHLSVSLTNSMNSKGPNSRSMPSNLYLTPKLFAHFWSWCSLFEGALSLPIRQGSFFSSQQISPKFGQHLATLKYRISLHNLYIMHGYIDDARETWVDGVVPWVGVKAKIDEFQADMHQREEELTVPGPVRDTTRTTRRKPFYAAEVTLKGLQLRALLAIFLQPLKRAGGITAPSQRSNYRQHPDLPIIPLQSLWHDMHDFVELDWMPGDTPTLHLLPVVSCPHLTYFKKISALSTTNARTSKFGSEHSHSCMLGREPSVTQIQIFLASQRLARLKNKLDPEPLSTQDVNPGETKQNPMLRMVTLLETYIAHLRDIDIKPDASFDYHLPTDNVSSLEWADFDNVYQIHLPSIFMDSAVRDIMMQYYYCSRDRCGLEYHMATRAVKFIRDQANATRPAAKGRTHDNDHGHGNTAMMAASAIRKMLKGDNDTRVPHDTDLTQDQSTFDAMDGWAEGVSLVKGHYCLLIKPQIVLRGESSTEACIVAAAQAKIQSFDIMDLTNLDDPVSGKVMSRNYASVSGFQTFAPTTDMQTSSDGSVPLEVLIDLRCESQAFERLVPQTEAVLHYDKFNQLRLHNHLTSVKTKTNSKDSHLQDTMDLIRVHLPRFTVSANADHFRTISTVVNKLLLFSDAVYKIRSDQVQTILFTYDFTDIHSTVSVITNLQSRLRVALETQHITLRNLQHSQDEQAHLSLQQLRAHIFLLSEELDLLFDAIRLAQDTFHDQVDRKSALLLHASSREISWRMLDEGTTLLSKLVVGNINFRWLSRQDSSTVSHLTIGNLSAFDGSRDAIWSEILNKYNEPANHPLLKRGLFLTADWTILPPVGGISVYEAFELNLHPVRLQIDGKVGRRIKEYVWPSQRDQRSGTSSDKEVFPIAPVEIHVRSPMSGRSSIDSPRALHGPRPNEIVALTPPGRKLGNSRSFTDLRATKDKFTEHSSLFTGLTLTKRSNSSDPVTFSSLFDGIPTTSGPPTMNAQADLDLDLAEQRKTGDAQIMRRRSVQKTFALVRIPSIHILLSMVKEGSFECRDARIKTRELEYHNQTWSFEELAGQFIPSNMNWRGWVKMALTQPLLPVLPVARELISKTKWKSSKSGYGPHHENPLQLLHPRFLSIGQSDERFVEETQTQTQDKSALPLTFEPEPIEAERPVGRRRVKSLFNRKSKGPTKQADN